MLSLILLDLTFKEIVTDIPHDFAAVVVYLILAVFLGLIILGSRSRPAPVGAEPGSGGGTVAGEEKAAGLPNDRQ